MNKITDGADPLVDKLRDNSLRIRLEGDAIFIEPFKMDSNSASADQTGSALADRIKALSGG